MHNNKHITLGIESSCDETAVGIVADGREVLANVISSQIEIHPFKFDSISIPFAGSFIYLWSTWIS